MRIAPAEFRRTPWHVHRFLADVPLHDVWQIRLEGGGPGRHLKDFRAVVERGTIRPGPVVRLLCALRWLLGAVFRLEGRARGGALAPGSYIHRLDDGERARSRERPGSAWGIFRFVYAFEDEALGEIINRTVHAFSFVGMTPAPDGYHVHWAIYVRPMGPLTRPYMALIDPFRRWLVYPSMIQTFERAWKDAYPLSVPGRGSG